MTARRIISLVSLLGAFVLLAVILYTATLIDRRPPFVERVSLSATAGGDRIAQTLSAIDIQFSEAVDHGSVERRFRIEPYVAGAISWDGSTAIFTPSSRLPAATRFSVTIDPGFADLATNTAPVGLEPWAFATVGQPTIVEATPVDGAAGLPVDGTVVVRFDRLMDTQAVEAAVRVEPAVGLRFSWSGDRLTIGFDGSLRFGTAYALTIGNRAADTAGNPITGPFALRFTTVSAGLGVVMNVPSSGVSGISVMSPIAVVFDAAIDPRTVAAALRITPAVAGESRVVAMPDDTAGPAGPTRVLLFTPSAPLAAHTTYSVTLAPIVARADDASRVAAGRSWTFTTGAPSTNGQNQVAFLSTRAGVRNLWLMNPDGSNPRQLTTELAPVTAFDVTGDGATLVYSAAGAVYVMRIDGTDRRRLTASDEVEYASQVSPDGRWVLVGRRSAAGADLGYWLQPLNQLVGSERLVLAAGAPPLGSVSLGGDGAVGGDGLSTWSGRAAFDPSGRWLLVVTGGGDVVLVDLQEPVRRTPPTGSPTGLAAESRPVWLAGQGRFGIVAREVGRQGTSIWALDQGGRRDLGVVATGTLDTALDGVLVTLARTEPGGTARLAVVRLGTGAATPLLADNASIDDRWPAFSPDGATILFSRVAAGTSSLSTGIWSVARSGGGLTQLTTDGAEPRWLP